MQRRADRGEAQEPAKRRHREGQAVRHPAAGGRGHHPQHPEARTTARPRRRRSPRSTACSGPGEPPRAESAREILNRLFFNPKRYDLGAGRALQAEPEAQARTCCLGKDDDEAAGALGCPDIETPTLCQEDFIAILKYLLLLRIGEEAARRRGDHGRHRPSRQPARALGGRTARNQFNTGLARMARIIRERMSLQEPGVGHAVRLHQCADDLRGDPELLRILAALAVHGPDEPARGADAQAAALGARARRPHARPRRLRGSRRAPHALRAHVPDRDAGRSEHRTHLLALDLREGQRIRVPRDAVPEGEGRHRRRRARSSSSPRTEEDQLHHRAGERPARQEERRVPRRPDRRAGTGEYPIVQRQRSPLHGRFADAARVAGRGADPVPRARRRQPRADGLEHAAAGRAASDDRRAAGGHRSRDARSPRTPGP